MAPSAGLTHVADTYGPGKQRGPTKSHRLEHPELHWGQRCMVGRPWVRGQSWNHNCYTFSTPNPGNLGTHFSLFCSPKTKHLRSGGCQGCSSWLFGGRKLSPSIVVTLSLQSCLWRKHSSLPHHLTLHPTSPGSACFLHPLEGAWISST